ncbi:MAG: DUF1232 domain-containing protein [Anaerolineae bacterium]|nr:DUF1232 domain-containing protein [Anaerolineae bacterium]NIN99684.1 DUF1232 domain-containing protein [Anaerolineae bacterium]NIQ82537.1 DUF1232 domain-containing protein [Anaerolineae bacterium]
MPEKERLRDPERTAGLLSEILKQGRLILRLLADGRVPVWPKLIIPATIAYILSPIDLLSDPILGLGQVDDIAVFLIGLKLFVELCPSHIVREHLEDLSSVIEGSYQVVKDEREEQETPPAQISAADQEPSGVELPAGNTEQE